MTTPSEYLATERNAVIPHILWDGEVFEVSGASREHNRLVAAVLRELGVALRGKPCRPYASQQRVRLPNRDRYVYPDASVICDPVEVDPLDEDTATNPRLIVEVLSPSTEAFDRGEKWIGYQSIPSLTDYLLVSATTPRIEHYARQPDGWLLHTYGIGQKVLVPSMGFILSVDDVYEGVLAA